MSGLLTNTLSIIGKSIQSRPGYVLAASQVDLVRNISKHWNPKFKKERKAKVIKVDLPDSRNEDEITEDERRSMMKKRGLYPPRPWMETGFVLACTGAIFEAYVPPEGDGKFSPVTATGMKQNVLAIGKKTTSMMAIRKIKSYVDDFNAKDFADEARDIYIKAHKALAEKDFENLRDYVTEKVYSEMKHNISNKQIRWTFIESLEPARIVRARNTSISSKDNPYGQLTVRFHTKQTLAIYDRFGRLMHGSEFVAKDVLEYIVFERHLSNEYGKWRIHGKIIPSWQAPKEPTAVTGVKPAVIEEVQKTSQDSKLETPAIAASDAKSQETPATI
ncbi:probable 39S ribosomal protein L45, mitochondrial [Belonocnema kinseyi]|uniref:probable 39S ribosomal protein L45, mitochondrial n=1 Tax=Belonocnema kinseyi TaxID=2817044 RepID=UPI00143DE822|nr:probable 39S ribosomal protein L45, mitochondrial [Belonocnema kinseyi]